jgi:uncharacterized membrane protein
MRKSEITALIIILMSFIVGIYFYPKIPEKLASHWNIQGQVDGYVSKFWGLFVIPIISITLLVFFILIPRIDPLKENIKRFIKYFDIFIILIILFLFYLYLLIIFWNLGMRFSITQVLAPAVGMLVYYSGVLTEHAKRNWFIGVRTPWTISNEKVWNETNKLGGKLLRLSGLIAVFGILLPNYGILLIIIPVALASVYVIIYSYFEYQRITKRKSNLK